MVLKSDTVHVKCLTLTVPDTQPGLNKCEVVLSVFEVKCIIIQARSCDTGM